MAFRIVVEFPALDRFSAALERYLDMQEGQDQAKVDALASRLAGSNKELSDAVSASTPKE